MKKTEYNIGKREVEFRAWDFDSGVMMYDIGISEDVTDIADYMALWSGGSRFPVMQYTNLRDRNGKKIFEGDVVQKKEGTGVVAMHAGCWCIQISQNEYIGFTANSSGSDGYCESIGNIFENEDLLF